MIESEADPEAAVSGLLALLAGLLPDLWLCLAPALPFPHAGELLPCHGAEWPALPVHHFCFAANQCKSTLLQLQEHSQELQLHLRQT